MVDKLQQARARDLSCFGSDKHRFRLAPTLDERQLRAFEVAHGVRLPAAYRAFLRYAGNGGAGPYYGIYPLSQWDDFAGWVWDEPEQLPRDILARPCPLTPDFEPGPQWEEALGVFAYQGTLSLGTRGCTYAMQLVVSGPGAGRVLYVDADGQPPYVVREPDFLSWYERWLDELLGGYQTSWFGYGPGGGERELLAIVDDRAVSERDRAEAVAALSRLPALSDGAASRVAALLTYPSGAVRAAACRVLQQHQRTEAAEAVVLLLRDDSATVRRQAIRAAMALSPQRHGTQVIGAQVIGLLRRERDADVASTAFFALQKQGALDRSVLLELLERPSPLPSLRDLAAHAMPWVEEDIDRLIGLLDDDGVAVRRAALLGLRKLEARQCVPAVVRLLRRERDEGIASNALRLLGELGDLDVAAPVLLKTAADSDDDFNRLDAVEALAMLGDVRVLPVAEAMLGEDRRPERRDASGFSSMSSVHSIAQLVVRALSGSPSAELRAFAARHPR